jgi:superfamily II DNA/RNA helicase
VALYAGGSRSGVYRAGEWTRLSRETIKAGVLDGSVRLLIGTDAASEGLNLQRLGTLINLDLPWNPTRLEQRKGRIQRIGQVRDEVYLYNMRYRGSVEDRVHQLLSDRLQAIRDLFGQIPDTLEDVWVAVARHDEAEAEKLIDQVLDQPPFELRYDTIQTVDWESCSTVLDSQAQLDVLMEGW